MAAYIITYLDVTEPTSFEAYRQAAVPSLTLYQGRPLVVDGQVEVLEGMIRPQAIVVLEFETVEQAKRWYTSPEYAPTIPLRQQSAESSVILVEGMSIPWSSPRE